MKPLKNILDKINDKCLLVNYINAKTINPDEALIESTISILCDNDKQNYLCKVRKWQMNFEEEIRTKAILSRSPEYEEAVERAWEAFWVDLEPDKNKDYLKDLQKLDIQFVDQKHYLGTASLLIKGELKRLQNNEECILINYVYVDFGEEIILSREDKKKFPPPCPVKNYFIKNKVAILCYEDKKEYLDKLGKWQQKYFSEIDEYIKPNQIRDNKFYRWIHRIWDNLEPNKNLIEQIPFLDVYNWTLEETTTNALKIEAKGEINHRWEYPNEYQLPR